MRVGGGECGIAGVLGSGLKSDYFRVVVPFWEWLEEGDSLGAMVASKKEVVGCWLFVDGSSV